MKVVFIADLHFGNLRVHPSDLAERLDRYLMPELEDADVLLIGGDLFHSLLTLDSLAAREAINFCNYLTNWMSHHTLHVRILRGTFSHDHNQPKIIECMNHCIDRNYCDSTLEVVDSVCFEGDEHLGFSVLYLPDNLSFKNSEECLIYVREHMRSLGVKKADFILGHGYFDHVLPEGVNIPGVVYNESQFDDLVNDFILMGHVHTPSAKGKVIYSGSFDRATFGEEEDKGFVVLEGEPSDWKVRRVVNKDANIFKTVRSECGLADVEEEIAKIDLELESLEIGEGTKVYIRIVHPEREVREYLAGHVHSKFPSFKVFQHSGKKKIKDTSIDYLGDLESSRLDDRFCFSDMSTAVHRHIEEHNLDEKSILTKKRIKDIFDAIKDVESMIF